MKREVKTEINDQEECQISKMMCQLLKQQSAPDIDIDIFNVNSMTFHYFMAVFNEIMEKKVNDPRGKLTRLIKYTTGDEKETLKNFIPLAAEIGFETVKQFRGGSRDFEKGWRSMSATMVDQQRKF